MSASYHKPKKKSSSHKSYGGSSGYKGYKGKKSGKKGKSHKSKHFSKKGAQKKGHNDSKKYYGDMKKGNKGHKAAKYGKKGHHHKGHNTKGFKNTYHKNEYSKKTKFYDSYDNGGYHKKYGGYKGYFGGSKGSKFKGGKDKAGYYGDKYGKKGHDSKGGHHSSHKGEKGGYGHKGKYGSKKAKGGGGYGHDDHHGGYGRSLPVVSSYPSYPTSIDPIEPEATAYGPALKAMPGEGRQVQPDYYSPDDYLQDSLSVPDYGQPSPDVQNEYFRTKPIHVEEYDDHSSDEYDDYNDYGGYDYKLEKEQERQRQLQQRPRSMPRSKPIPRPKYYDERPMPPPPDLSHQPRTTEAPYYVPQLADEDPPRQPRRRLRPLQRPKMKRTSEEQPEDINYYQDLSDPKENRRGYTTGFYKSWKSPDKRKNYRRPLSKRRSRSRGSERYIAQSNARSNPVGAVEDVDQDAYYSPDYYPWHYHPFSGFHQQQ